MYSVYQQLRSLLLGAEADEQREDPNVNGTPTQPSPAGKKQSRYFTGVVTGLGQHSGMIDHQVFFELESVIGGQKPRVGSSVHVSAEREHAHAGWRARRVEVTSEWQPEAASRKQVLIGYISRLSPTLGVVDCSTEEVTFSPYESVVSGYKAHVNDWVQVSVLHQDGESVVCEVRPLRERSLVGTVTMVSTGFGLIDSNVYFTFSSCVSGYRARVGDDVNVVCVEYRHPKSTWRAVRMEPLSKSPLPTTPPSLTHTHPRLLEDKGGVRVTDSGDFGSLEIGEEKKLTIVVSNYSGVGKSLLSCKPLFNDDQVSVVLPQATTLSTDCSGGEREESCTNNSENDGSAMKGVNVQMNVPKLLVLAETAAVQQCNGPFKTSNAKSPHCCHGSGDECEGVSHCGTVTTVPPWFIPDGGKLEVVIVLKASTLGQVNTLLIFNFGDVKIARYVRANVTDDGVRSLGGQVQRARHSSWWGRGDGSYQAKMAACKFPGERPLRSRLLRLPRHLKLFPIPDDLRACVEEEDGGDVTGVRVELGEPLCMENYSCRFSSLLFLEELRREEEIRRFDMYTVGMRRHGPFLSLAVPGLAERRPSLLVGDKVIVCEPGGDDQCQHWEGYIHEVHGEEVLLKFTEEFHRNFNNEDYDVMFTFNRTPLRRMHHAAEMAEMMGSKALFPGLPHPKPPLLKIRCQPQGSIPNQQFFNPVLNPRQKAAVSRIVGGQCRPAPYILFGPPGTGKTVTLVEAILQVYSLSNESRILTCAPSNSAADLLAERLHLSGCVQPGVMVRLNAVQRFQSPPPSIEQYCLDTDSIEIASRSRIVVATCVTGGMLHALGLGVEHFTHVFVDEAGQATEPECLVPVSLVAGTQGQVILAGDPYQLGPVLSSPLATSYGLGLSLLERLMGRPAYCRNETKFTDHGNYDPLMVTKLVDNYRSHPVLLRPYSDIFYHGELQVKADPGMTHTLSSWELLPRAGFPLIFHGVQGEDMREGNSPSWFNPVEAVQVVKYTQALRDNSTFAPKLSDIGIITPYRKQVQKVRLLLKKVGLEDVKVGSVEEFQGQERLAIIISTVRSTRDLLTFDLHHHLGFLSNPKRFNVSISRAQALLIVIGNPHLLSQDTNWSKLVQYAVDNGAYTGCPLPTMVP